MSLKGAFAKIQNSGGQFYLKLAQSFNENPLIRDTWAAMAQDLELQAASLNRLQPRLWKMLRTEEEALLALLKDRSILQSLGNNEDRSLHSCFTHSLDFEEPLILGAYVRLIRLLRTEMSDQAIDFYIIVKSHIARISRMIQPFSVDPTLLQRAQNLQQHFEFGVQSPPAKQAEAQKQVQHKKKRKLSRAPETRKSRNTRVESRAAKRTHPLSERVQRIAKRAKPLVRKMEIQRRRVRR